MIRKISDDRRVTMTSAVFAGARRICLASGAGDWKGLPMSRHAFVVMLTVVAAGAAAATQTIMPARDAVSAVRLGFSTDLRATSAESSLTPDMAPLATLGFSTDVAATVVSAPKVGVSQSI